MGSVHAAKQVKHAEDRGYSHAWLYDSQMLASEVYASLALSAAATSRIKLGPGVTNPKSRIAPLTACGMASINELAPGRAILGIGTGNTTRRTLGMPAARLEELRAHIEVCQGLFKGELTDYAEGDRHRKIKFLNPDMGYINIKDPIPVYISASGPKVAQMAGEIADGVILFGAVHPSIIRWMVDNVKEGARRAGRDPARIYVLSMTAFYLTKHEKDLASREVREAVGPMVASSSNIFALSTYKNPEVLPADFRAELSAFTNVYKEPDAPVATRHIKLYSGYLQKLRPEHEALMTEKIMRATTLVGTKDQVIDSIRQMHAAGVHQVAVQPILDTNATIDQFANEIMPAFR
jgi:alkanesulfonate monooxygenase SsuD/methylene tetrahydromethanopterin reductase-like flavin-dependent oxidoreductase (luciferase family)